MESELKPWELVQAASIARRYFIDGQSKTEIAQDLGISRFRVARILERARESGLVRVSIVLPAQIDAEASERLRAACRLHHAVAVAVADEPEEGMRSQLGVAAAGLLAELVVPGDVLGIGWGRTLDAMAAALSSLAPCAVVQLTGAAGTLDVSEESVEIVRRVARLSGGVAYPIYAPLVVDTTETASALRRQPHVAEALRRFDGLTKVVTAVGTWDPPNSRLRSALSQEERDLLQQQGARAEVCTTLWDDEGRALSGDFVERTIAIRPDQLRRVPEVIAVGGGKSKLPALRGFMASGVVTSLVTDTATARALIASPPSAPR